MELKVLLVGVGYVMPKPKEFVEYVKEHGIVRPLIEELESSLELLEGIAELEKLGLVEQTKGYPTATLIDGTRKLLRMLREAR